MGMKLPLWDGRIRHVVVDIETLGTQPGCVVTSIGAYGFNGSDINAAPLRFLRNIDADDGVLHGLVMDPSTVYWWMEQDPKARAAFQENAGTMKDVLWSFYQFYERNMNYASDGVVYTWCHANFDVPVLDFAFGAAGLPSPWSNGGFRFVRDMRTIIDAARSDKNRNAGVPHRALDDAETEARDLEQSLLKLKELHAGSSQQ